MPPSASLRRPAGSPGRALRAACALALAVALACAPLAAPGVAWADVRKTDLVMGTSVEQRGLPAALCPNVAADYAALLSSDGTLYFERDADAQVRIASITKVMTAIVALDSGAPLDTPVTVSARAAQVGESSAGLLAGDTMTLESALKGLMIPSGNDAAIAIAETLGPLLGPGEPEAAFVAAMNAKAAELGMEGALFANPHGLDNGSHAADMHCSARDVATMCSYAMKSETFRSIVAMDEATIPVTRADGTPATVTLKSTDKLIGVYEGACGIKTGYTEAAGQSFAGACERGGEYLYAIVLHSTSENQRFDDAEALYNWVYGNRVSYPLAHSDRTVAMDVDGAPAEVPVVAEVSLGAWLDKTVPATFADPDAAVEVFAPDGNVSQSFELFDVNGAVSAGDTLGRATFYQANEVVAVIDVVAAADAAAPGFFEGVGIWWDRLWRGLAGEPTAAESVIINDTPLIFDKTAK
ncbi:D-alanyl-D-alanine carboxypeptidase family protein [Adlercreutzia faecimuris]|uniref:D-alanyl-D-alanine carboxypeptidase n=1 Tax=Adlercreutzia faecimuris TaxID=2897341 RepID=A0ABS9WGD3_9ACTN|nr:D-alanyl-D-alanine carboxypeptidase [Adlercreutzia sp. JBNU-10]MCI2241911.1 D-alanyl-D-alanine carboxypeptidase [Adlercreutzia sp. JBNU-10]